jgi:fatty acid desaturase
MSGEPLVRFTAHALTREDLHALMARSDGPGLVRALCHLGTLAVTGALLWRFRSTAWAVPLVVAHGYVLAFTFCAFHEAAHRTAFRTRWLNVALGTVTGLLTLWPYRNYRVFHWEHHRFTQDPARDPELYFPKPASLAAWLYGLTGIPNAQRRLVDMLRLAAGRADRPWMAPAERGPLVVEARAYLAVYLAVGTASVLAGSTAALLLWIGPLLVGQVFLRPYLLAEHTGCASTRDCLENTRTTLTLPLVRLFAWNMPYHAEHHAYPGVPFHALPRLHGHVRTAIAHLEPGYVAATTTVNRVLFGSASDGAPSPVSPVAPIPTNGSRRASRLRRPSPRHRRGARHR